MDVAIGPINSEEEAFRRRKLPPPETPEQRIENFSNALRCATFDAVAHIRQLIELAHKNPTDVVTHIMHDRVCDDLDTVSALAAMLFDAAWMMQPTEKRRGITMTTEKMVQRARKRMQEAQEARRVAVKAWVVETAVTASPAAEREAWRSVLQAHAAERSAMEAYRHAAAARKREHERGGERE